MNPDQHLPWSSAAARGGDEPRRRWLMARALGALATGIAASRVAELAAVAFLGVFLAARFGARVRMPRW